MSFVMGQKVTIRDISQVTLFHETCQMFLYLSPSLNQELDSLTWALCCRLIVPCEREKNTVAAKNVTLDAAMRLVR
jgi:hypothetical protein